MDFVKSLKDLEKLLKLARKQGITELTFGAFSCKLGDLPGSKPAEYTEEGEAFDPHPGYTEDELDHLVGMPISATDEELLNWAAQNEEQ